MTDERFAEIQARLEGEQEAQFIVHAPQDIRDLLAEVKASEARINKVEADKSDLFDESVRQKKRAIQAERERDVLIAHIVLFMCGSCPTKNQCHEQEPKADCLNVIRDWAAKNAVKVGEARKGE